MNRRWNQGSFSKIEKTNFEQKTQEQAIELALLQQRILQIENNYAQMEQFYTHKVKVLTEELKEKDIQYEKLKKELSELRKIGSYHLNKVQELVKKHTRQPPSPRMKSVSSKAKSRKSAAKLLQNGDLQPKNIKIKGKSYSPDNKKLSPPSKIVSIKKPFFQRTNLTKKDNNATLKKNTSSDEVTVKTQLTKRFSPKKSTDNKAFAKMRVDEKSAQVEKRVLQTQNKKTGLGGLKERVLVFK